MKGTRLKESCCFSPDQPTCDTLCPQQHVPIQDTISSGLILSVLPSPMTTLFGTNRPERASLFCMPIPICRYAYAKSACPCVPLQRKLLWTIFKFNEPYTGGVRGGFILCMHIYQGERWNSSVIGKIHRSVCFFTHMHICSYIHMPGQAL